MCDFALQIGTDFVMLDLEIIISHANDYRINNRLWSELGPAHSNRPFTQGPAHQQHCFMPTVMEMHIWGFPDKQEKDSEPGICWSLKSKISSVPWTARASLLFQVQLKLLCPLVPGCLGLGDVERKMCWRSGARKGMSLGSHLLLQ